ncbi:Uncharacterised protein [Shigella sonnei]|nr:Uncharacterised protein [Shigella sonnei]
MSFKLLQHRPQVGAFLEQQLPVQLENVLQVAAEYAPHELVTYGLPGHSHQPITHGRLEVVNKKLATELEFFQYRFSDSFGGNPPLYSCGLSAL